ncbi:histone-lysine N-methyltransferase [Pycnococcus provasolii]
MADLVGTTVFKVFKVDDDGDSEEDDSCQVFPGVVKSYDEALEWYMVEYEDGDREELSREDVEYLSTVTEDNVAQNYPYAEELEDKLEEDSDCHFDCHTLPLSADSTPQTQLQPSKLAVDYLQQAASQGYPEAISALGEMYGNGRGVAADVAKAKALQDQSDELREWENKKILPKCFDAKNLEARALEGDAHAMHILACSHVNADDDSRDMAVRWYKTAAEDKGYLPAMHALGVLKVRRGDKDDKTFAEQMSERAAYAGYMPALKQMCRQHQDTPNSLFAKVLQLHTTTTTGSSFWQQGISLLRNWWEASPSPSPKEADFRAAAQAGDPHALYGLAHCNQHGLGVAANPALAEQWYKQAAVQGYAPAQHALGNLYASGHPVTASQHRIIAMTTEQRNHGNGHLLCDYELQREQKIKYNNDRMRQLIPGIDLIAAEQPKAKKPRVAREVNRIKPKHAGRRVEALWSNEPFGHVNAEVHSGHLVDYDPASDTYSLLYEDGDIDEGICIFQHEKEISVKEAVVEKRLKKLGQSSNESRISATEVDTIHPKIRSLKKQLEQIKDDRAEQRKITRYRFTVPIEKIQPYTRSCKPEPLIITKDPGMKGLKLCDVSPQGRLVNWYVQHIPSLIPEKLRNAIAENLRNLPWRQYWHKVMGTYRPHGRLQFLTCFSEANCAYFLGDKPNDPEKHCALGGLSTLGTPSLDHESLSPIKEVVNAVLHSWIGKKYKLNQARKRITVQVNRYFGEETVGETKKAAQGIPMHGDGAAMDPDFPIIHLYILDDAIVRVVKRSDVGGSACRAKSREGVRHSQTFRAHAGSATILIDDSATFHGRSPCKKVSPCGSISMVLRVMDDVNARRCARGAASRLQQHPTLELPRRIHFSYVCAPQDGNQVTADATKIMQFNEDVGCKLFADESAGDVRMAKRRGRWQPPLIFESRSAPELLGLEPHMYSTIVKGKGTVVSSIYLRDASLEMENTSLPAQKGVCRGAAASASAAAAAAAAAAATAGKNQNPTVLNVYLLRRNYFGSIPGRHHASIREADVLPCDCTASSGCSATSCLNRRVFMECIPGYCPCGPTCTNQMFSRRQYANLECKHTGIPAKGRGLFAKQSIPKGGFVIEYTGEVLDEATYVERKSAWLTREGSRHTYFMSLSAGEVIDASRMGNLGRFTNHSCAPNCEMQKWTVRGEVCIGIFATRDIQPGEEVTMDYNFERCDERPMRCYCGESKCKGFVGGGADAAKNFERADVPTIELHADPEVEFTAADFEEEDEHLGMRRLLKMPEKRSSGAAAPRRPTRAGDSSDDSDYDDGAARRERRGRKPPKQQAAKRAKLAPRLVENRKSEIERRLAEPGMMEKGYVARASLRTFVPLFTTAVRIDSDAYTETQRLPFSVKDLNILLDAIINIPRHDHRQELMAAGILQQIFLILRQRVMCVWSRQHDPNVVAVARKTLMALNSLPLEASKLRVVKNLEGSLEDLLKALMTGKGVDGQVAASARSILIKVGVEKSREELEREERKAEAAAAERRAEERRAANADSDHLRTAEPAEWAEYNPKAVEAADIAERFCAILVRAAKLNAARREKMANFRSFEGDFLGNAARSFRTFEDARAYVRTLNLKSQEEWQAWSKSGSRPPDIPSSPSRTYKSAGWLSYGDFLGYADGKVTGSFRTFEEARAYVRTLGLKSEKEWKAWSKSGARPHDIPGSPDQTYASTGWTSYPDFLGYADGKVAGSFRTFEEARSYVRTLGLKSKREWEVWSKSGARPHDIPSSPQKTYKSSGWTSYPDFLGYGQAGEI